MLLATESHQPAKGGTNLNTACKHMKHMRKLCNCTGPRATSPQPLPITPDTRRPRQAQRSRLEALDALDAAVLLPFSKCVT
jgi:hypothetical protein